MKNKAKFLFVFALSCLMAVTTFFISAESSLADTNQCYWLTCGSGQCNWVGAPQGNISKDRCYALDSCDGGLGQSYGGCYKWASAPNADRIPWQEAPSQQEALSQGTLSKVISISGAVDIIDDEVFGTEDCLNQPFENEIVLNEGQTGTLIDYEKCCGDEVRAELFIEATNNGGVAELDGYGKLYEGTNCDTDDLEDEEGIRESVSAARPVDLEIDLYNSGSGSGDSADFYFVIINSDA